MADAFGHEMSITFKHVTATFMRIQKDSRKLHNAVLIPLWTCGFSPSRVHCGLGKGSLTEPPRRCCPIADCC